MGRLGISAALILAAVIAGCGPGQNYPPGAPVTPTGPTTQAINVPSYFSTRAFDHEGDSIRYLFSWGDGTHSSWTPFAASGAFESAAKSWSETGTYLVEAIARDLPGGTSDSSSPLVVSVVTSLPNRSPNVPQILSGPDTAWIDSECTFSATGTDPDNDSLALRFDWGDGDFSNWLGLLPSGGAVADSYTWPDTGSYSVRVMAKDSKGLISDWSAGRPIVIRESATVRNPNDQVPMSNR
jgi:hypothetical protein